MLKVIVFTICLAVVVAASAPAPLSASLSDFDRYVIKFQKRYSSDEAAKVAFENFKASVMRINKANAASASDTFALNRFSDMSVSDFKRTYLSPTRINVTPDHIKDENLVDLPVSFFKSGDIDWRREGFVTAVKDQANCGSCWAFSAVEEVESMWIKAKQGTNKTAIFAPQQVVDCDTEDDGCDGGDTPTAYEYLIKAGGIEHEKDYPYKARDEKCRFEKTKAVGKIKSYSYATSHKNETMLEDSLQTVGPISICVNAEPWMDYDHGVFHGHCPGGDMDLDHCVQLVGYGEESGTKYWLVRNSWAEDWGEKGYIKVEREDKNLCGIATEATVVVVDV